MENEKLALILGTLGVLPTAISIGPTAALLTAFFVCGLLIAELARRGP
jgi:hypothetical protein